MRLNISKLELALAEACKNPADITTIGRTTFYRIQRGADVRPATAGKLARELGVNVSDLIEHEDRR